MAHVSAELHLYRDPPLHEHRQQLRAANRRCERSRILPVGRGEDSGPQRYLFGATVHRQPLSVERPLPHLAAEGAVDLGPLLQRTDVIRTPLQPAAASLGLWLSPER